MIKHRSVALILSVAMMILFAGTVFGQGYPDKRITIVTDAAGSGNDIWARIFAQGLASSLGQPVVVDNRPSGVIPREIVAKSPPDGYTLLFAARALWLAPRIQKMPYTMGDFSPITLTNGTPHILVVNPKVPAKTVKELIDLAKAKPGALNYSTGASGSSPHIATEVFKAMAGVNIMRIAYSNASARMVALISGEVDMEFGTGGPMKQYLDSGQVRALGVSTRDPFPLLPAVPPIAATVPNYESVGMSGFFAPAKTPSAIISLLNREIIRILNQSDVKKKYDTSFIERIGCSPEETTKRMNADVAQLGKLLDAGVRMEMKE